MNLTDDEMKTMVEKSSNAAAIVETQATNQKVASTRRLLIIGCGDGGCNIASAISQKIPDETFVVAYNTSDRNMGNIAVNYRAPVTGEDGSGKKRKYSKDVFKDSSVYEKVMATVGDVVKKLGDVSYIVITTTTDGGTGSGMSPMLAKLLVDNTDLPVFVIGVYPSRREDAQAQFNAIEWQIEMNKIGVPYFLLDNDKGGMGKRETHTAVNAYATKIAMLVAGKTFGNTNISIIDNHDFEVMLNEIGGRMVAAIDDTRPTSGQSLNDYIEDMLQRCYQPLPSDLRGLGVFVKGPKDLIDRMDTDVPQFQSKYGNAVARFVHIEESEFTEIAILATGCSEAAPRLTEMKARYDDIMQSQKAKPSVLDGLSTNMMNPLGGAGAKKRDVPDKMSLSALDL